MFSLKLKGVSKIGLGALGGVISAILGAFFGWVLFPLLVTINIDKQTILEEGTETFERFVDIPQPLSFKVYIFNVTNPNEVIEGGVPKVKEIGPYIYREYRHRDISGFSPDKNFLIFRGIQKFIFDEEASLPLTENDDLVILNVQLNSVVQMAEGTIPPQLGILNGQLKDVFGEKFASIFMTVKPIDLLFNGIPLCVNPSGIASFICSVIKNQKPQAIKEMDDGSFRFSMFGHKNNTDDGLFEIHTGVGDIKKLGLIRKWNKKRTLKTWQNATNGQTSQCNYINGTDTTVYAPHIKTEGYLEIFAADVCRSARVYFKKKVRFSGIEAYHFETESDFLEKIGPEFGDGCFCIDRIPNIPVQPNGCLYKGAMDLSTCQVVERTI